MVKTFFKNNFVAIFAIFVAVFAAILSFIAFGNRIDYEYILANGIETQAEVLENTYYSSLEVNGVSYYTIDFEFIDENGNIHRGTTSETFTYQEIARLCERGIITIKYDPETFDAIEASYDPSQDSGKNVTTALAIAFLVVDAILWVFVVKAGIRNLKEKKIEETGKEYTANVTGIKVGVVVNNVPRYKVMYTWIGENGTTMSGSSKAKYYQREAEALEQAGTIQIKAVGNISVITTSPDMCKHDHYGYLTNEDARIKSKEQLKCDYCGHNISEKDEYCANCGARVNFYK